MNENRLVKAFSDAMTVLNSSEEVMLDSFGADFGKRVYSTSPFAYLERVKGYGLCGLDRVLDVGCGLGQWSFALAEVNHSVLGVDGDESRTQFASRVAASSGMTNCSFERKAVCEPMAHGSFDGIFCFGVLPLVPWRETVSWMWSMLADDGLLYANANGLGWYKYLWYEDHNAGPGYDPKERASLVLANTLQYERSGQFAHGQDVLVEPIELTNLLRDLGAIDIRVGPEGSLAQCEPPHTSFFRGSYLGDLGVYEVMARKPCH